MTGTGLIRPATSADVDAIAAVEQASFPHDAWSTALVRSELKADRVFLVTPQDGDEGSHLAGYVDVSVVVDVADLLRIAVAPQARRRGVAAHLLAEGETLARSAGAHRMLLEVAADNTAAVALYEQSGYTVISRRRRYYRNGADALVMEKTL